MDESIRGMICGCCNAPLENYPTYTVEHFHPRGGEPKKYMLCEPTASMCEHNALSSIRCDTAYLRSWRMIKISTHTGKPISMKEWDGSTLKETTY